MRELQVIGAFSEKPGHILLLGDDGQRYDYDTETACIRLMDDDEVWRVDVIENASIVVEATSAVFSMNPRRHTD